MKCAQSRRASTALRLALGIAAIDNSALATPTGAFAKFALQGDAFVIAMLPDTQEYTTSPDAFANFMAQTSWIAQHVASHHIVFVTHVGDSVDDGGNGIEWGRADEAMDVLSAGGPFPGDGVVPYSVALGNHDYDVPFDKSSATQFVHWFGPARYAGRTWFLGNSADERNFAQVLPTSSGPLLHLALEWHTADSGVAWAQGVIAAHPDLPAFITTHEFLSTGNPAARETKGGASDGAGNNSAQDLFDKLIEPFPQVFAVLCGHLPGNGWLVSTTVFGREVQQILADYQNDPGGGNGWMRLLEFRPALAQLAISTYSPSYVPGVTSGPDRALDTEGNFVVPVDLLGVREDLRVHTTLHFRRGQDFGFGTYAAAHDAHIGNGSAGTTLANVSYGFAPTVRVALDGDREQALIEFEDLVGSAPGQIAPGTTIERAVLSLTTEGFGSESTGGATLHRMNVEWGENSTWNSLGAGVQLGLEAELAADGSTVGLVTAKGTHSFDVTAGVQAWVSGAPNHGWVMLANNGDRWDFRSCDWNQIAERPLLSVRFASACPSAQRHCVGAPNSYSNGAWLSWTGSTSIASNDAALVAHAVPPNVAGLFFLGARHDSVPFGAGFRCIAPPLARLGPPLNASATGLLMRELDYSSGPLSTGPSAITAGSTWSFQAWYRDPARVGGGTNTSDALEVSFCPR